MTLNDLYSAGIISLNHYTQFLGLWALEISALLSSIPSLETVLSFLKTHRGWTPPPHPPMTFLVLFLNPCSG